jgi:CRP-like cAMP-binding protein
MKLEEVPALQGLNATQFENIRGASTELVLPAGASVISRGETEGSIYFLLEGELRVFIDEGGMETELVRLTAPSVVGELELLTEQPRTASVSVISPARLLALSHDTVRERIADGDPAVLKVMLAISKALAGRLATMTEKFIEIERDSAPAQSNELRQFREKLFSDWSFDRVQ